MIGHVARTMTITVNQYTVPSDINPHINYVQRSRSRQTNFSGADQRFGIGRLAVKTSPIIDSI